MKMLGFWILNEATGEVTYFPADSKGKASAEMSPEGLLTIRDTSDDDLTEVNELLDSFGDAVEDKGSLFRESGK